MSEINWDDIQESNILVLKENDTIDIIFLDNGIKTTTKIFDKRTNKEKTIPIYVFSVSDVKDNNEVKEFSIIQTTLMTKLKDYLPLMEKHLSIHKKRIGLTEFDIDYDIILHK